MEEKKKSKKVIAISAISVVIVLAIIGIVVFVLLNAQKIKLYNSTLELGQENFLEELTKQENVYIKEGYTYSVKDSKIDINNVGTYEVIFEIKGEGKTIEEVKQVKVVDTTPPTIELKKDTFYIGDTINIEEIVKITDLSQAEEIPYSEANVKVEGQFDTSKEGESSVKVSATDKNGNTGTQEITIKVENPIISLYDYIIQKVNSSKKYTNGSYEDKFVIKYAYNFGNDLTSKGWINFTDKVHYSYNKLNTGVSTIATADLTYFSDTNIADKVYINASLVTGDLAVDTYLNNGRSGFRQDTGDLSTYQNSLDNEISSINNLLNNKNNIISLNGKTIEQLKNETIDLRELQ